MLVGDIKKRIRHREDMFLRRQFGILAKMAKADGRSRYGKRMRRRRLSRSIRVRRRGGTPSDAGCYFGLTAGQDQSGDRDAPMHVTKAGNMMMRQLLVTAANYLLQSGEPYRDERVSGNSEDGL